MQEEYDLVLAVKNSNCSRSLAKLYTRYRYLILKEASRYIYVGIFDRDDFFQEALIVCYESCLIYDPTYKLSFARFYRLRLQNHFVSIYRKYRTLKRGDGYVHNSYENLVLDETSSLMKLHYFSLAPVDFDLEQFFLNLSWLEIQSMEWIIGSMTYQEFNEKTHLTEDQLRHVLYRCRKKLLRHLGRRP